MLAVDVCSRALLASVSSQNHYSRFHRCGAGFPERMAAYSRKEAKFTNARLGCMDPSPITGREGKCALCEMPHPPKPATMAASDASPIETTRVNMQMQQIRYFLALCEERNFTRAAERCGVTQPSLTNAIIALERVLGGALFQRKPAIALTVLGHAVHPYLQRIAENAGHARDAALALALASVRPAHGGEQFARSALSPST